jgi:hypothetical protein
MRHIPKLQQAAIVLVGHFNPLIFRPSWFAARGLIGKEEAEKATVQVIHPEVVTFALDWLRLQVQRELFVAESDQEPFIRLADLVTGCFNRLKDTPVSKMGINRRAHIDLGSMDRWHSFGDILAPKDYWKTILKEDPEENHNIGLRSLTIERSTRPDKLLGVVRVKVEPSISVPNGVFLEVNDHFDTPTAEPLGCEEILEILLSDFSTSIGRSEEIIDSLVDLVG